MVAQVEGGIRVHRLFSFSHEAFNSHSLKVYSDGALPCARLTSARSGWAVSHEGSRTSSTELSLVPFSPSL